MADAVFGCIKALAFGISFSLKFDSHWKNSSRQSLLITAKMRNFLVVLLVVVAVISASDARRVYPRCRNRNEVFKTCGTACERSCERPNPEACTLQCVQGCQCRNGYLRDVDGRCVKPCDCSVKSYPRKHGEKKD